MEPLAEAIRSHPDIHGVSLRQREYNLSLFSDDILLTLTSPHTSLPNLHALVTTFGPISGYKINPSKTEVLPIHIPPLAFETLQQNLSYHWCSQYFKHLGIHLTSIYHQANYSPLFWDIDRLLRQWDTYPLSLLGQINVLKMSILPGLLYLFQTLPVPIPMKQLKATQRLFLIFIWHNKAHHIASSVAFAPRSRGGLGAPDLLKYYYATHPRATISLVT